MCLGNQCGWEIRCSGRWRSVTIIFPTWPLQEEYSPGISLQNTSFHDSSMDFSQVQQNEASFLPKPQSSVSIELFYLSSNILINRTRYSPRSYTKLVLGLEPKLGCSRTSHSKLEPEYIPKMNVTGFGKLPRRNHSGCRAAGCPAVSHSALITFLHRESRPQRLPQFLWCFALWLSPSNYHPLFAISWHCVFSFQRVHVKGGDLGLYNVIF